LLPYHTLTLSFDAADADIIDIFSPFMARCLLLRQALLLYRFTTMPAARYFAMPCHAITPCLFAAAPIYTRQIYCRFCLILLFRAFSCRFFSFFLPFADAAKRCY